MMMFQTLAYKSLVRRKGSVLLTIVAMTVSIFVLLATEHIRHQAKESFASSVSGIDLIVGSRTSSLNLLLYSVFRVGAPSNNISWEAYQAISKDPKIKWTIPISLGDSHKGYRVLGTNLDFFKYFRYGKKHPLSLSQGKIFDGVFDVVLGAEVARKLGYQLADQIVLSHGIVSTSFNNHDKHPFTVVGILEPTGTPVDQTLHVELAGIEAIHANWPQTASFNKKTQTQAIGQQDLQPKSITAFMLGLNSRLASFTVQRNINNFKKEPLMAVLPGVALSELWQIMAALENSLRFISGLILISSLAGLSAMLMASLRERRNEITLLRVLGASPLFLFLLIQLEALMVSLTSMILAAIILKLSLIGLRDTLAVHFGLHIQGNIFSENTLYIFLIILLATILAASLPSVRIQFFNKR